jgi:hypothetical protein
MSILTTPKFNEQNNEPEIKKINLRADNDKPLKIKAEEIPNLVPEKILTQWMEGDADPYFKIQELKFPLMANGYNYTKEFFESFVSKINKGPIPGSKDGHLMSWGKRAKTDFILVGAKIENGKKEGSGKVYLKNYIPPVGESGDNEIFLKELKSNMIDFSLVAYTKDEREEKPDGTIIWNVIESTGGERNDAVPYGLGAMEQKTNVNNTVDDSKNNNRESKQMGKQEVLETLKTLKTNAEVTLPEVAAVMGLESQLITDDQQIIISKMNTAKKLIGDVDIIDFITEAIASKKENALKVRNALLTENFGDKVIKGTQKENTARIYAERITEGQELTEEKINEVKNDTIFKKLSAENADVHSDINNIEGETEKNKAGSDVGGSVEV